jgi:sodium-dependent dicarboxylate transporter 2/3/5
MADSTPLLTSCASHLALGAAESQCRESGGIQSFWRWLKGEKGRKMTVVVAGPLALVLVISFVRLAEGAPAVKMLGAVLWLAIWWLFEAVPICITALLPLVLFPFLQLMQADHVAEKYMNDTVVLMLGTFILALGIERFSLHKRIALRILLFFGGNPMDPRLVLLGFCIGPAFISMWMSNSAAAVMMIPMATGVLKHLNDEDDPNALLCRQCSRTFSRVHMKLDHGIGSTEVYNYDDDVVDPEAASCEKLVARGVVPEKVKRDFQVAVILAITYATAIGGLATLTGCGPNLVLPGIYSGRFPDAPKVTYLKWMMFALPLALPFLIFEWLLLCWLFCPLSSVPIIESKLSRTMMEQEYVALGT